VPIFAENAMIASETRSESGRVRQIAATTKAIDRAPCVTPNFDETGTHPETHHWKRLPYISRSGKLFIDHDRQVVPLGSSRVSVCMRFFVVDRVHLHEWHI
jgi:hypothetical protein